MKILIMQSHQALYYFITLRLKYSPEYPVSNTLGVCSSLNMRKQITYPYKITSKNYKFKYLNLYVFRYQARRRKILK
jgi:hypothetical protein